MKAMAKAPPLTALLRAYRTGLYLGEPALVGLLGWRARRGKEDAGRLAERRGLPLTDIGAGFAGAADGQQVQRDLALSGHDAVGTTEDGAA